MEIRVRRNSETLRHKQNEAPKNISWGFIRDHGWFLELANDITVVTST